MSAVGKSNIKIIQGATFRKRFVWNAGGAPVNLTDWKARMQIRPSHESKTVIAELTTENGMIVITPEDGVFQLDMPATITAALSFEEAVYDIELEALDGYVKRIVEGRATLLPEVTKDD